MLEAPDLDDRAPPAKTRHHRDVSAENILVSRTGAVKMVDFGIAKAANQRQLTARGIVNMTAVAVVEAQACQ
jgi:tRNA A-37 threonylcarbamoyl transferase component Bud32